jgi:modification methylase
MIELNNIYNMDCLEGMKLIEDNSIDLIITSPPYNNYHNRRTQKNREDYWSRTNIVYDNFDDKMSDEDYADWQIRVINEMVRVLKPAGTIAYNHKDRIYNFEVLTPLQWILKTDAVFRQRITWDRCGMQAYNPVRFYRVEEDIYLLGKTARGFTWNKEYAKYLSIWRIPPSKNGNHPCSFPEEIPKRLIEAFSNEGDVVLDPFSGSGTTSKVAKDLNRNYIGFEISPDYCELSRSWINCAEETTDGDLWGNSGQ